MAETPVADRWVPGRSLSVVFLASLVGRLAYSTAPLAIFFTAVKSTDSYVVAGASVGLFGLVAGVLGPFRARLVDRLGTRKTLPFFAGAFSISLFSLLWLASTSPESASGWLIFALAAIAGAFPPPFGPLMRAAWVQNTKSDEVIRRRFSLDTVCEEAVYVIGPALVGSVAATASNELTLLLPIISVLIGTAAFAVSERGVIAGRLNTDHGTEKSRLPTVLYPTSVIAAAVGFGLGGTSVLIPIQALEVDSPAQAGLALGALSLGSAVGGAIYTLLPKPPTPVAVLLASSCMLAIGIAALSLAAGVSSLVLLMVLTGCFVAPTLIAAYLLVQNYAPVERRTEASSWINTSHNLGSAGGGAIAGVLAVQTTANSTLLLLGMAVLVVAMATAPLCVRLSTSGAAGSAGDE